MDPATKRASTVNPAFTLSARQEQLLFAALNSNTKQADKSSPVQNIQNSGIFSMAPTAFSESPVQAPASGTLGGLDDSPFIDYEQDFEFDADGSYDYGFDNGSQGQMIGKLPGTSSDGEADSHDKRSHPDDEEEDEDGGGKRREGDEKSSKKPGRKPLTSEPTTKRKAQNRAAQRAFRERKEKHLKDLETKVEDLQKASESANHENSILRAQIEKMSTELKEYKKRLSVGAGVARSSSLNSKYPAYLSGQGLGGGLNNPNDVNFSFEFPKFGRLPGPPLAGVNGLVNGARQSASPVSTINQSISPIDRDQISPRNQSQQFAPPANTVSNMGITRSPVLLDGGDMSSLSGLFSPSILESVGKSPDYDFFGNRTNTNGSRSSGDGNVSTGHNTSYSSPSASSNSNNGPNSSCGTSPEPTMQSPQINKPIDSTLTTIGEEHSSEANAAGELTFCDKLNMACGNPNNPIPRTMSETSTTSGIQEAQTPAFDINGIDWFAQQNDNQFDPQLFNDYREPQDNILSTDVFGDNSFFGDAYTMPDFSTPYNVEASPIAPKKDLVQQIDEQQNADEEVVPADDRSKMLSCNTIWDRLQACPKVKEGDFDLDNLCKDLQKKAKCSETGAVVDESDFQKIMKSYVDNDNTKKATR
ncbi:YAP1 redox [Glarea lozoyensis ATCC 20868]|uniref:YAP1 redox n=1 Tax=Glarea lozoyensis (strain ATCC 20868 / MF5171) TaxID=1116229 RepID=S3CK30_GLAL2|nr:YAP1 redox [Glarea lozoyensis ATCC 20868]EPE25584.1 YAP1 redox [Glarea lozoyensis ATCC 20868]